MFGSHPPKSLALEILVAPGNREQNICSASVVLWIFYPSCPSIFALSSPFWIYAVCRALRLLRILKLSHYNSAMEDLFEAIFEERRSFYAASYLFAILFILSSTLMYFAEYRTHPTGFQSIPDSMYWALITLTTVGYGDITPITVTGKLIAVGSAILGVIVVAHNHRYCRLFFQRANGTT